MNFKVGEHWKGRDGNQWRILATDCKGGQPIAALEIETGDVEQFGFDGLFHFDDTYESQHDLIELWKDPTPKLKAWLREPNQNQGTGVWGILFFPEDTDPSCFVDGIYTMAPWLDPPESK